MEVGISKEKFNDDLLIDEADRGLAKSNWPAIFHVLDYQKLKDAFLPHDNASNLAKRRGRRAGLIAIGLGFVAICSASAEHLVPPAGNFRVDRLAALVSAPAAAAVAGYTLPMSETIAIVAAMAGIMSVAIGAIGVWHAAWKREWLEQRLVTERFRQFHFQVLVFRLPEILRSLHDLPSRRQFLAERDRWFAALATHLEARRGVVLSSTIENDDDSGFFWPELADEDIAQALENEALIPVFEAYRELRINHQLLYAETKLQPDHGLFSKYPKRQSAVFGFISLLSIVGLFGIHFGVIIGVLFPTEFTLAFRSDYTSVAVIWLATSALAVRALEAGLQPEREIERYQAYRSAVRAILQRFDHAKSAAERHDIMMAMERLSFDEMRDFLTTNERAQFVI